MAINLTKILFDEKSWLSDASENTQFIVLDGDTSISGKSTRQGTDVHPVRRITLGQLLAWLHSQGVKPGVFPSYTGTHSRSIILDGEQKDIILTDDTTYCTDNSAGSIKLDSDEIDVDQYYTAKVTFIAETTGPATVTISGGHSSERISHTSSISSDGQFVADVLIVNLLKTDDDGIRLKLLGNNATVSDIRVNITYLPQNSWVNVNDFTGVLWVRDGDTDIPLGTNDSPESYLATH